ncbi:unnamed protein product [Jaminaea pallidilutea]
MSQFLSIAMAAPDKLRSVFKRENYSSLKPVGEFFDVQRVSRPQQIDEAIQRITWNTRHFAANYLAVIAVLSIYGLLTSPFLIVALVFMLGGFFLINRFAAEPMQVGEHTVTQKSLYTGLFVIGLPLLWIASPFALLFWLVGSSAFLVLSHAAFMEPPVSSEYAGVETV